MTKAFRWWAFKRRLQYGSGVVSFFLVVMVSVFFLYYYQPPNCYDGIKNGDEVGVDCGGSCVPICASEVIAPRVVWAKSFEIAENQYNVVAYIENPNPVAAAKNINYTFELFSKPEGGAPVGENEEEWKGDVVATVSGSTELPPGIIYPIFAGRVVTELGREVTSTELTLEYSNDWQAGTIAESQFRTRDIELTGADDIPRLKATVENTELFSAEDVEVVATIFNEDGEAVTASQTYIESMAERSTADVVFTWPNSIAMTVKSCIVPTDVAVVIDLSGSMNNDGGDPPQPITDTLSAASSFVQQLQKNDQIAVVTFATDALVAGELSKSPDLVSDMINKLTIDPNEEQGYTNTAAALQVAQVELNSVRHNTDARRVIVLLTDGLPTSADDEKATNLAKQAAQLLRDDSIEVYAIGLGSGVNQEFIETISSTKETAYLAPSVEDLSQIYTDVTSSICVSGFPKIDVIAKGKTQF